MSERITRHGKKNELVKLNFFIYSGHRAEDVKYYRVYTGF